MALGNRVLLCGALAMLGLTAFAQTVPNPENSAATPSADSGSGVVVEGIQKDLGAEKAGLIEGDVLWDWVRGDATGKIQSPFDLADVEIEQAPRGNVTLHGLRGGEKQTWVLGPVHWGIDVRPNFPSPLLAIYLDGKKLAAAGKVQDAAERWQTAAGQARESQPSWVPVWFLFHAGQALARARQWKEADAAFEQAIHQSTGAMRALKAQLLRARAMAFQQRVDWVNAEKYYQEAAALSQEPGRESLMFADTLNEIGNSFYQREDLPKAETYYSRALEVQQKLAPGSFSMAKSLFGMGKVAEARSDLDKAEKYFNEALAIQEKISSNSLDAANILNALGVVAIDRDNFNQAERYYLQALSIRENADPDSLIVAASLNNLGNLFYAQEDLAKAEDYHRQSLSIKKKLAPGSLDVATSLNNLGLVASERGDLAAAEEYHRESLSIKRRLAPGSLGVANSLTSLADVVRDRGDLERAEELYRQALAIQEQIAPGSLDEAASLNALGLTILRRGDPARAEDYLRKALAIREKVAPYTLDVASSLYGLGRAAQVRGDLDEAEKYLRQVLAIAQKLAPDSTSVAEDLYDLGSVLRDRGDLNKAEAYYRQGVAIWEKLGATKEQYVETLAALAEILKQKQQLDASAPFFEQAVGVLESQISNLGGSEEIRSAFRAQNAGIYRSYIDLLIRQKHPEQALQVLERSRAQTLLEMLVQARIDVHQGVDAALLEQEHSLQADMRAKVDRRIRLRSDQHAGEQVNAINREIDGLLVQYSDLQGQIRVKSPAYAALTQPQSLSAKEIQQQLLDDGTVLLEYSLGTERSHLFVVTATSLDTYELPKRAEIDAAAGRFYELLARNHKIKGNAESEYSAAAAALSRMVLAPVSAQIKGKRLLIVSDGTLQYIPFAVLPEPDALESNPAAAQAPPLLVEHEIVNLPSVSVLAVLRKERIGREAATKAVAVLADPVFAQNDRRIKVGTTVQTGDRGITRGPNKTEIRNKDKEEMSTVASLSGERLTRSVADVGIATDGVYLPRLRFTRREAEAIMAVTPAMKGMKALDFDASRATATSPDLAQYRVVHFATHGLLDNQHPELSGVVLSLVDEKGNQQNGFLDLQDIYNLNLPVELVVLSACETGLGKEIQGEGLVGLTRGFMYAGASRVVASLWRVDDVATAELMRRFYKAMEQDGLPPAAALRRAQIEMSKQRDWSSPYYWAAFQLQGEWK